MSVENKKVDAAKCDVSTAADGKCCGSLGCACKSKCPGGKMLDRVLCSVLKLVKIAAFIGVTLVLFDVHGMFKATVGGMPTSPVSMQQSQ